MSEEKAAQVGVLDHLRGENRSPIDFAHLDLHGFPKLRSLVQAVMPHVFSQLEAQFDHMAMRREGVMPVMYHLAFTSEQMPLRMLSDVECRHRVYLYRSEAEPGVKGSKTRLLESIRFALWGTRRRRLAGSMADEDDQAPLERAAEGEILQVFTRPLAAPGKRDVVDAPEQLAALRVHPYLQEFPTVEWLLRQREAAETSPVKSPPVKSPPVKSSPAKTPPAKSSPANLIRQSEPDDRRHEMVWGLANTDVNQHVNVVEYLMLIENQTTLLLHQAGIDVARYAMSGLNLIVRKPFFPGQVCRVRAALYRRPPSEALGERVRPRFEVYGTVHLLDARGEPEERPALGIRSLGTLL